MSRQSKSTKVQLEVMTPDHPRWWDFVDRLCGSRGVGKVGCHEDLQLSRRILERMRGIDVEASLEFFEHCGGFCDCEVVLSVVHRYEELTEFFGDSIEEAMQTGERELRKAQLLEPPLIRAGMKGALLKALASIEADTMSAATSVA